MAEAKIKCQYCGKEFSKAGIANHEKACPENPQNKVNIEERDIDTGEVISNSVEETDKDITIIEGEPDKIEKVKLKDNLRSFIGSRYYNFVAGKVYEVPSNVKDILQRADMLEAI